MAGRPTKYTKALGDTICQRLADGESLRSICRDEGMPDERTVRSWTLEENHPISPQYAKARESQYLKWAEELLDIADDGTNDYVKRPEGGMALNAEHINRSRLRVDTRKWLLSKMLPKVYGDKLQHSGPDGGPLTVQIVKYSQ